MKTFAVGNLPKSEKIFFIMVLKIRFLKQKNFQKGKDKSRQILQIHEIHSKKHSHLHLLLSQTGLTFDLFCTSPSTFVPCLLLFFSDLPAVVKIRIRNTLSRGRAIRKKVLKARNQRRRFNYQEHVIPITCLLHTHMPWWISDVTMAMTFINLL